MFSFTRREKQELAIGTLIFVLVELSIVVSPFQLILGIDTESLMILIVLSFFIFPLWLLHELGHKIVAQSYNLNSEFRLYPNFAIISLMSVFFPFPKIVAPGVVHASGHYSEDIPARISLVGPLINILLGGIFLIFGSISSEYWNVILLIVSKASLDLALFNLLPISVLDGAKVYRWNTQVFILIFTLTLLLWLFHPFGLFGS